MIQLLLSFLVLITSYTHSMQKEVTKSAAKRVYPSQGLHNRLQEKYKIVLQNSDDQQGLHLAQKEIWRNHQDLCEAVQKPRSDAHRDHIEASYAIAVIKEIHRRMDYCYIPSAQQALREIKKQRRNTRPYCISGCCFLFLMGLLMVPVVRAGLC